MFEFAPVKNVNAVADLLDLSDRGLMTLIKTGTKSDKNRATKVLMLRYKDMVCKNWSVLLREMNNSDIAKGFDTEYEASVYTAFAKTIEYVKLERIEDDGWSFGPILSLFLLKEKREILRNIRRASSLHTLEFEESEDGKSPVNERRDVSISLASESSDPIYEVIKEDRLEKLRDCIREEEGNMTEGERNIWKSYERHYDEPMYGINVSKDVGVSPSRVYTVVGNLKTRIAMRADSKYSLVR